MSNNGRGYGGRGRTTNEGNRSRSPHPAGSGRGGEQDVAHHVWVGQVEAGEEDGTAIIRAEGEGKTNPG